MKNFLVSTNYRSPKADVYVRAQKLYRSQSSSVRPSIEGLFGCRDEPGPDGVEWFLSVLTTEILKGKAV